MPAVIDAAKTSLVGHAGRPVSRYHVETALRQLDGVTELVDDALREAEREAADPDIAALRPRLHAAAAAAKAAIGGFEAHLRDTVLPSADGEGRLGAELFATKMRHTLKSAAPSTSEILERAELEYAAIRVEMVRIARELWPTWCPDQPLPTAASAGDDARAEQETVRRVLDAIAADHPAAEDLLRECEEELVRIEAFCRERDLVGLADEPLEIRWTPVFLRAFGGAMLDSPGPLDKGQKSFFSITPIPEDWTRRAGRVVPARGKQQAAPPAHDPRGGAGPLPPGCLRESLPLAGARDLLERRLRRGVGGLRDPGDDGSRLRRRRPRPHARPLEVLPAVVDQRDHRPEDPCRRDDRGRGGRAHGRRRLPGGIRGTQQVQPGPAVVDAALDVLRRGDGHVGHRAGAAPRARGGGRRTGGGCGRRRARASWRSRRHAGLPLPRPPRARDEPRFSAAVPAPPPRPAGGGRKPRPEGVRGYRLREGGFRGVAAAGDSDSRSLSAR